MQKAFFLLRYGWLMLFDQPFSYYSYHHPENYDDEHYIPA